MRENTLKLLAMIITDGCITGENKKIKIRFINKSESLHKIFRKLIIHEMKSNRIKSKIITFSDKNSVTTTEINSNILGRRLKSMIGKDKIFPRESLENASNKTLKEIISLMFSCDGSPVFTWKFDKKKRIIRIVRRIKFSSKNKQLLEQTRKILQELGFNPQTSKQEIIIERKKDVFMFFREIGFVEKVEMSKSSKWLGLSKNDVLNLMVLSFL